MKTFIALVVSLIFISPLAAQHAMQLSTFRETQTEEKHDTSIATFSITADSGILFGMIYEWVFYNYDNDGVFDEVLSRLDWQQKSLFYTGVAGNLILGQIVYIGFGAWLGLPGYAGYMEDRDWNWETGTGEYSVYSISENIRNYAIFTDLNIGFSFLQTTSCIMNLLIGFSFRQYSMYSQNTYVQEPPGALPYLIADKTIDYESNFYIFYLGAETTFSPVEFLTTNVQIVISPFITFGYARDIHYYSFYKYFQDVPVFGFYLSITLGESFHLSDTVDIQLKTLFMWAPPFKGKDYYFGSPSSKAQGGSSFLLGGFSVCLAFSLDRHPLSSAQSEEFLHLPSPSPVEKQVTIRSSSCVPLLNGT